MLTLGRQQLRWRIRCVFSYVEPVEVCTVIKVGSGTKPGFLFPAWAMHWVCRSVEANYVKTLSFTYLLDLLRHKSSKNAEFENITDSKFFGFQLTH